MLKLVKKFSSGNRLPISEIAVIGLLAVTFGWGMPAHAACTTTGGAVVSSIHCGADYIQYKTGTGDVTLTVDSETSGSVELRTDDDSVSNINQTLNIIGNTTLNRPDYSAVIMETGSTNRNATVNIGSNVDITSVGGFGGVWIRNVVSGNVIVDNAGTIHSTGAPGIQGTTNLGSVTVINSGSVTSTDDWGLYADGGFNNTANNPAVVTINNSGTVNGYTAGARAINYFGNINMTNSGTVNSATRQGMIGWAASGIVSLSNTGTVTSGDDNALHAAVDEGDIIVYNSGNLVSSDDPGVVAVRTGYSGIRAEVGTSGSVSVTNAAGGTISSVDDYGITAITPLGNVTVLNNGSISALSGISTTSNNGNVSVTNNGLINVSSKGVYLDGSTNTLNNSGTIATSGTLAIETNNNNTTITNSGTINAGSSSDTAIAMGNGNNRLAITDTSVIVGKVTNGTGDNTLELSGTGLGTIAAEAIGDTGQYQGFDTVEKTGSGTWKITGDSSALSWSVIDGTLSVSGTVKNIEVLGGTLSGTGNVGSIIISSGGTLAPGNSIGTASADDVTFSAGSSFEVEVNAGGSSDRVMSSGIVKINSGSTITILPVNGTDNGSTYDQYTTYTIINATGGVQGKFDNVVDSFAFLDVNLRYDANNVLMGLLRNSVDFNSITDTKNQSAVADGIETQGSTGGMYLAVVPLTEADARYAFNQLSGEVYASTQSMLLDDSRFLRESIFSHVNSAQIAPNQKYNAWISTFGSRGDWDGDSNVSSLDRSVGGVVAGVEKNIDSTLKGGLTFGYSYSDFAVDTYASSGEVNTFYIGAYAEKQIEALKLTGGVAYGWHDVTTDRNIAFSGYSDETHGDYEADSYQLFGEGSYSFAVDKVRLVPFANMAYVYLDTDSFSESGGDASLHAYSSEQGIVYSTMGLRVETQTIVGGMTLKPNGSIGWLHRFGDDSSASEFSFDGGGKFTVEGVSIAHNMAVMEFGLANELSESTTINFAYNGKFADDMNDQSIRADFRMKF